MSYPSIYVYHRDTQRLREFLAYPNGSMSGDDLTVDAVEGDGLLFRLRPRWMYEPSRVATAERMRYQALIRAYRALRDLGDNEGAALLNELANKEWSP
ncbi:hypothetical protein [Streptomyces sp. NPDC056061]|uniref:hypothetical protein n=1 Tax=Streptomyces sp. NPDC056061 TaxID=3345700 RepID=UPI0035DFE63C